MSIQNLINEVPSSTQTVDVFESNYKFTSSIRPLLVFFMLFAISFYFYGKKVRKCNEKSSKLKTIKDLPCIQNCPWMPSIIDILVTVYKIRKDGLRMINDAWSSVNHSRIFTFKNPLKIIIITDPNLTKQILSSPLPQFLHKPKLLYHVFSEMTRDGLVASHPNTWKPHRKIFNQYFTHRMLLFHLKTMNKYGKAFIQNIKTFPTDEIKVDKFSPILNANIFNIILEILLGAEITGKMGMRDMLNKFKQLKSLAIYRTLNPQNIIPFIWKLNPKRKSYLDIISYYTNYMEEAISKSKMALKEKQVCEGDKYAKDLSCMEHMILQNFNNKEIRNEVSTLLAAGHDTTDITFHFIFQHLAEHPDVQRKCQDEIDSLFDSKQDNEDLTFDDLTQLKYLEQCILETLRLTPTFPQFSRQLHQQTQVGDYLFEKGTIFYFPTWLMHRDPEIYPEPDKFDPDRFLPENVKERHPYAFLPFSMGPRNCIGWRFAMMQLKTILSMILRHYDIYSSDQFKDVKILSGITLRLEKQFNLVLHRRSI